MSENLCPLCNSKNNRPSWFGSIYYERKEYKYLECLSCLSLFCENMPDADTLEQLYGSDSNYMEYLLSGSESEDHDYEDSQIKGWLERLSVGTFIDYGCGHGKLLTEAEKIGWKAVGIEYDRSFASMVEKKIGVEVFSVSKIGELEGKADVLFLGDVLEHLTEINVQFPNILRLLKPNGVLLAEGPLEANFNLFFFILKYVRKFYKGKNDNLQPQHVIMATRKGQLKLFERFGLEIREFTVFENEHPAPVKLYGKQFINPRMVGMYGLRKLSKVLSLMKSEKWGNRYFFAGTKLKG